MPDARADFSIVIWRANKEAMWLDGIQQIWNSAAAGARYRRALRRLCARCARRLPADGLRRRCLAPNARNPASAGLERYDAQRLRLLQEIADASTPADLRDVQRGGREPTRPGATCVGVPFTPIPRRPPCRRIYRRRLPYYKTRIDLGTAMSAGWCTPKDHLTHGI